MVYRPIQTILLADDNTDDCELVKEAWAEFPISERLRLVNDGIELLDYLYRRGEFMSPASSPRPSVILLDLNMPRMTGLEVLAEIKQNSAFAGIPIVVLTTSKAPRDIIRTAGLRVNGYMQKPNAYAGYLQIFTNLRKHWAEILDRPFSGGGADWSGNLAWC
ncbi:MAG: response regulator [Nitrospirota bacterium]|jgi:CheY-like chemotaxis protein